MAPREQRLELECEEGSSAPQVLLHGDPTAVRSRLRHFGWQRVRTGWYRREFDGWTADLTIGLDGSVGEAITVTLDDGLGCGDLLEALRGHEFRVRRAKA